MKHLFGLIFSFKLRELFFLPTNDTWVQMFRSLFVGGLSFLVDSTVLFVIEGLGVHYLVSAGAAFIFGLAVNFMLSRRFVFAESSATAKGAGEFFAFAVIGVIGLAFTELLMYLFTDIWGLYFMLSKAVAAIIVLLWNFSARKLFLYRSSD